MRVKVHEADLTPIETYEAVLSGTLKRFPTNFWNNEESLNNAREIIKYLIEVMLAWDEQQIKVKLNKKVFTENRLKGMLSTLFNSSPYDAIKHVYPGRFKEWELQNTPLNFWDNDTGRSATIWLLEVKLGWSDEEVKKNLTSKTFYDNGLCGMISVLFNGSAFKALNNAYPNKYKPWELRSVPIEYWTIENAKDSIKWLIEEKLKLSIEEIPRKVNTELFNKYHLKTPLDKFYRGSIYLAFRDIYPDNDWTTLQSKFISQACVTGGV